MEVNILLWEIRLYVFLNVLVRHLIAILELPVVIWLLLHSVVSQVDKSIGEIIQGEFFARGSNVAILVEVTFEVAIDWGQ